ncbi:putative transcription factor PosF21 [Glycine soja]
MDRDHKSPPFSSSHYVKLELSSSDLGIFIHDINRMPKIIPDKNKGHKCILTLPDDITFDIDLIHTDEDLLSLYLHIDQLNSSPLPQDNNNNGNNSSPKEVKAHVR